MLMKFRCLIKNLIVTLFIYLLNLLKSIYFNKNVVHYEKLYVFHIYNKRQQGILAFCPRYDEAHFAFHTNTKCVSHWKSII